MPRNNIVLTFLLGAKLAAHHSYTPTAFPAGPVDVFVREEP